MAAANGFVTVSPDAVYGDADYQVIGDNIFAQKFTCPGTGTIEISEIGAWFKNDASVAHLCIYTDNAAEGCPHTVVTDSDSGELSWNSAAYAKVYKTYSTKPQLMGGTVYWLCMIIEGTVVTPYVPRFLTGGITAFNDAPTYPNFFTYSEWESGHIDSERDWSMYAVYGAGGPSIPILMNHYMQQQ